MTSKRPELDFAMVMASAVHDMKNSLSMVLHSLEQLNEELNQTPAMAQKVSLLQYEASRVNNDLVQLLGLYKLQNRRLAVQIDEHFVHDFLDEQKARYSMLFSSRQLTCELACDESLIGYFDLELVAGVVNNVLANTIRYTRDQILITASEQGEYLEISINDNGRGFPEAMLRMPDQFNNGIRFETGSTNLGLYFANEIARLHQQGENQGYIELSNGGPLGGGLFKLYLP